MNLEMIETLFRWFGGLVAWGALGFILYGIWRGTRRPVGRISGRAAGWLRSAAFYLLATAFFLALSVAFWKPLPLTLAPAIRSLALVTGVLFYFPGLAFLLWARLTLGRMYFVSTAFGAQLFANHQLIKHGPYAIVRHPMYLGLIASAVGSLLLYQTWTTVAFAIFAPFILFRSHREEQALAAEFGEEWLAYSRCVPPFFPRFTKRK